MDLKVDRWENIKEFIFRAFDCLEIWVLYDIFAEYQPMSIQSLEKNHFKMLPLIGIYLDKIHNQRYE